MKRSRFSDEQIIGVLKEQEAGAVTADEDEALLRIWALDPGGRQPPRGDRRHARPGHVALLAAAPERTLPMPGDEVNEGRDRLRIGGRRLIRETT